MATVVDTLITEYSLKDNYSGPARNITQATGGIASQMASLGDVIASNAVQGALNVIIKGWQVAATSIAAAGGALATLAAVSSQQSADMEADRLALSAYTGSAEELTYVLNRLKEVARLPGLGLQEAIRGSAALQAVGFDARLAERALLAFGNALASVGRGKDDLSGVIVALSQIVSKGKVSAEEINQIAERVPQIRGIMASAFGTADTEAIAKNFNVDQFITGIIAGAEKLPRVAGGMKNAYENAGDAIKGALATIGDAVNTYALPALNKMADFVGYLTESGTLNKIADQMARAFGAQNWGDALVNLGATLIAAFQQLPAIIYSVQLAGQTLFKTLAQNVNVFIATFNGLMERLRRLDPFHIVIPPGRVSELGPIAMNMFNGSAFDNLGKSFNQDRENLIYGFNNYRPSNTVGGDTSQGSINSPASSLAKTADNTAKMVDLQRQTLDITKSQLGGGNQAKYASNAVNLSRAGRTGDRVESAIRVLADTIREEIFGAQLVQARLAPR